jgi:hypothetical protein
MTVLPPPREILRESEDLVASRLEHGMRRGTVGEFGEALNGNTRIQYSTVLSYVAPVRFGLLLDDDEIRDALGNIVLYAKDVPLEYLETQS